MHERETAPVDTRATNWTYSFGCVRRDPNLCLSAVSSHWTGLTEMALVRSHNLAKWHLAFVTQVSTLRDWRLFLATGASEVKWSDVEVLGDKSTLGWPYTERTWVYCDHFIWRVSCTLVVLTCFVMCGCVYLGGGGGVYFDNCVGVLVIRNIVFTVCTVFLYCFVYVYLFIFVTNVRTTATEWQLNCSNNNNNNNNLDNEKGTCMLTLWRLMTTIVVVPQR